MISGFSKQKYFDQWSAVNRWQRWTVVLCQRSMSGCSRPVSY
jgi:hypothetical protein